MADKYNVEEAEALAKRALVPTRLISCNYLKKKILTFSFNCLVVASALTNCTVDANL